MNSVNHFEIPVDDKEEGKKFYSHVFGWEVQEVPVKMGGGTGTYTTAVTTDTDPETHMPKQAGAINGAIIDRQGKIQAPVITITVESLDEHLKKVEAAGGKVIEGKQEVEEMGYYAYVTDPAGNVIGLWEMAPKG